MNKQFEIVIYTRVCGLTSVLARGNFFGTKTKAVKVMRQEKQAHQLLHGLTVHGKVLEVL